MEGLPNIIAPSDNRVFKVNTQGLSPSQALGPLAKMPERVNWNESS